MTFSPALFDRRRSRLVRQLFERSGRRSICALRRSLCGLWPRNQRVALLAIALVLAVGVLANTDPGRLLAVRADEHHVRDVQWRFDLDDAGLPRSAPLDVLLDDIDAFDDDPILVRSC